MNLILHAVDTAIKFGAKQVFLPTVSSRSHMALTALGGAKKKTDSHFIPQKTVAMKPEEIRVIDENGNLKEEVKAIIRLIKEHDVILQTGHIDYDEMLEVMKYCKEIEFDKVVLTHISTFTTLDTDKLQKIVDFGGYVDINESMIVEATPKEARNTREELISYIRRFTPERCILLLMPEVFYFLDLQQHLELHWELMLMQDLQMKKLVLWQKKTQLDYWD